MTWVFATDVSGACTRIAAVGILVEDQMQLSNPSSNPSAQTASAETPRIWTGLVLNDNYRIASLIEQGSTFELYEGTEISTNEPVALKVLLPELATRPSTVARFLEEARVMARFFHSGLVRYRTCARDPLSGLAYIVLDSPGPRLSARIHLLDPAPEEILALSRRLAGALAAVHGSGFIHGHLSPKSVLLPDDLLATAEIAGLSLIRSETSTAFDNATLDASYLAPEQQGQTGEKAIGPWTDVYSLALVILAVANGKDGCRDMFVLPKKLRRIVATMLQPSPRRRPRMAQVVARLNRIVSVDRTGVGETFLQRMTAPTAAAARRGALAAAALLIAATPWLLQTSLNENSADARAVEAPLPIPAIPPAAAPTIAAELSPVVIPTPPATAESAAPRARLASQNTRRAAQTRQSKRQERDGAKEALAIEIGQTAQLNVVGLGRANSMADQQVVETDVSALDLAQEAAPAVNSAATTAEVAPTGPAEAPTLLRTLPQPFIVPDVAIRTQSFAVAAAQISDPMPQDDSNAKAVADRVRAGEDRRLREWCRIQRRRCTFPAQP